VRELAPGVEDVGERTELALEACNQILSLGWRMGGSEEEAADVFVEGRALVESLGDRPALALLVGRFGIMRYSVVGSGGDYAHYGEEGALLAQACDDPALRAAVGQFAAWGHWAAGDGRRVLEWTTRVQDGVGSDGLLGRELVGFSPLAAVVTVRVHGLMNVGRLEEAWSQSREAERVVEELHELEVLTWLRVLQAGLAYTCGVPEFTREQGRRSLEIAEQLGNESSRFCAYLSLGYAHLMAEDPPAARQALLAAAAVVDDHRTQRAMLPLALAVLAEAELAAGERTAALATARKGIELGRAGGCRYFEAEAQLALARALLATDGAIPGAEIESALERAEELVESTGARALSPRILELRGRLVSALGDAAAADRLLREALDLYRAIRATGHAKRLATELGVSHA